MVNKLWTRWYEFVRDEPALAFVPMRISDEDAALEVWAFAGSEPGLEHMTVIHRWRVAKEEPLAPRLQPGPNLMVPSLEGARALLPATATLLEGLPLVARYTEAWLLV